MNEIALYTQDKNLALRKELAALPDFINKFDAIEKSIFNASLDTPFGAMEIKQIALQLQKVLPFIMRDVGYRIKEGDLEYLCVRMPAVLSRSYPYLTIPDLKLAFEFAPLGMLDEYLPKKDGESDRGHYQSFDLSYIGKIISAYNSARKQVMKKAEENRPKEEKKVDYTPYEEITRRRLNATYIFYKYHDRLPLLSNISEMLFFNILCGLGYCEPMKTPADEGNIIIEEEVARIAGRRSSSPAWWREYKRERKRRIIEVFNYFKQNEMQLWNFLR